MTIDVLLFDLGKVLVDFDLNLGTRRFAPHTSLPIDQFREELFKEHWLHRYERGEISSVDYHRHLCDNAGLHLTLEEFHEAWSAMFLPELIVPERFLDHLCERYPLVLVSNTNESHFDFIARHYSVFDYFPKRILSYEVGAMKPDRRIYEAAIAAAGKPPESLFFTDDREENVAAAAGLGINAHLFRGVFGLVNALKLHGVDVGDFVLA